MVLFKFHEIPGAQNSAARIRLAKKIPKYFGLATPYKCGKSKFKAYFRELRFFIFNQAPESMLYVLNINLFCGIARSKLDLGIARSKFLGIARSKLFTFIFV